MRRSPNPPERKFPLSFLDEAGDHASVHAPFASADLNAASGAAAVCKMPSGGIGNAPCPISRLGEIVEIAAEVVAVRMVDRDAGLADSVEHCLRGGFAERERLLAIDPRHFKFSLSKGAAAKLARWVKCDRSH
jgi:hypothetical protein